MTVDPFLPSLSGELLQIYWHNKLPILAVSFDPISKYCRFATGGADSNVRIWEILQSSNEIQFIATLSKHIRAVNCLKWSPFNEQQQHSLLATAGDGGSLFIWHFVSMSSSPDPPASTNEVESSQSTCNLQLDDEQDEQSISKETWKVKVALETSNPFDIYALEWSPCARFIATGTSDDSVRIYSVKESRCIKIIRDHSHFVNGISWDPLSQFLVSLSSDRSIKVSKLSISPTLKTQAVCKIWKTNCELKGNRNNEFSPPSFPMEIDSNEITQFPSSSPQESQGECIIESEGQVLSQKDMPIQQDENQKDAAAELGSTSDQGFRLFADEGLISFFRKGTFTPDGAYFYAPAGLTEHRKHCVHVFIRNGFHLNHPIYSIAGFDKPSIGIFFLPKRMLRASDGKECWIFAVLTTEKVFIFESENRSGPIFVMQNYHLSTLTDASWQPDGKRLLVSSTDGFISIFNFDWRDCYEVEDIEGRNNFGSICASPEDEIVNAGVVHENGGLYSALLSSNENLPSTEKDFKSEIDLNSTKSDLKSEIDSNSKSDLKSAEIDSNSKSDLKSEIDLNSKSDLKSEIDLNSTKIQPKIDSHPVKNSQSKPEKRKIVPTFVGNSDAPRK